MTTTAAMDPAAVVWRLRLAAQYLENAATALAEGERDQAVVFLALATEMIEARRAGEAGVDA